MNWLKRRFGISNLYFFRKSFFGTIGYLALFSGLIILIDIMMHMRDLLDKKTQFSLWITYYGCLLAKRLDVLIPFALGIAAVQLLNQALRRCEFVPLLCAGRSIVEILKPIFVTALLFALFLFVHYQIILPKALPRLSQIESSDFGRNKKEELFSGVGQIMLENGSRLLFSGYSSKNKELECVFLINSFNSISFMNILKIENEGAEASYLQDFERDESGSFRLQNSYTTKKLPQIHIDKESLLCATAPPKQLSLSQLFHIFPRYWDSQSERSIDVHLSLLQKLTTPLFCLLAVLIPMLTTIDFGRKTKVYSLFITAALLLITQIFLQAFSILARTSIVSPASATLLPWIILGFIAARRFNQLARKY